MDVDGTSRDNRVQNGILNHHDAWAQEASRSIDSIEVDLEDNELEIGDSTVLTATVQFESDETASILELATVTIADTSIVSRDGSLLVAEEEGTTSVTISYRGASASTDVVVVPEAKESPKEDETEGDDDGLPGFGIIVAATSIGTAAYTLSQRGESRTVESPPGTSP